MACLIAYWGTLVYLSCRAGMQLLQNDIDESRVIINNHVVITIPWPGYKSSRSLNTMASAVICVACGGRLSGVSEPGPTRAWALASKAIFNYIHK